MCGSSDSNSGCDRQAVMEAFSQRGGGVFGLLNTLLRSLGAVQHPSFRNYSLYYRFYYFQLLQTGVPYLEQLKKEGESGREKD